MATQDACVCKSVPTSTRCRKIRLESAAPAAWQASDFVAASTSSRAPAAHSTATPTGPTSTMTSFAGWRARPKIRTGASRADGNGRKASPRRRCGRARPRSQRVNAGKLGIGQIAPLPGTQGSQVNVHDSHAPQPLRFVTQSGTHAADLPIQSLGKNHAKRYLVDAAALARLGQLTHDFDSAGHHLQRKIGDGAIHRDDVFFFVIV